MPINRTLVHALIKEYGIKKGKEIYYAMESDDKDAFKKGMATAMKEKHTLKHFPRKRKKK